MITTIIRKFGGWVLGIVALIGAFITVWASSRSVGKAKEQAANAKQLVKDNEELAVDKIEKTEAAAQRRVDTIKESKNVASEVNSLGDGVAADRLREQWNRDAENNNKND